MNTVNNLERDFQYAQQHPEARQEFINAINLEEAIPYICKVTYHQEYDSLYHAAYLRGGRLLMRTGFNSFFRLWKGQRSVIIIYPEAFSSKTIQNSGDFYSMLIDHEGTHAKDFFEDPHRMLVGMNEIIARVAEGSWSKAIEKSVAAEQRAIYCQIKNFKRRNCSQRFSELILEKNKEFGEFLSHR